MKRELKTFYKMLEDVRNERLMELTCRAMGDPELYTFSQFSVCLPHD